MIEYIQGDLIKSDCDVIIHGCNCFNCMGSGIAKTIKEIYPDAYKMDCSRLYGDKNKLGTFTLVKRPNKYFLDKKVYVVNAYTQYTYGRKEGEIYADYDAIKNVMIKINDLSKLDDILSPSIPLKIGIPKLGSGLAGGDWDKISGIINGIVGNRTIKCYYL